MEQLLHKLHALARWGSLSLQLVTALPDNWLSIRCLQSAHNQVCAFQVVHTE